MSTFLGVAVIVFLLFNVVGGDPTYQMLGRHANLQQIQEVRHEYGFDQPAIVQFLNYLKQIIRIPFTDQCFYINNFGIKLTERRENCQRELTSLVYKLMKEKESSEKKEEMLKQETTSTNGTETNEEDDSKEWKIF
jgi:hypothetical protein